MLINPDAHSTSEIDLVRWGFALARKRGITSNQVLNCFDVNPFAAWVDDRKQRALRQGT